MEGSIVEITDIQAIVKVPELGQNLKVSVKDNNGLALNQKVLIGIRPEYIRLTNSSGENAVLLNVARTVENVVNVTYYFHTKNEPIGKYYLEVLLPKSEQCLPAGGQECYLYLPPERLVIIKP